MGFRPQCLPFIPNEKGHDFQPISDGSFFLQDEELLGSILVRTHEGPSLSCIDPPTILPQLHPHSLWKELNEAQRAAVEHAGGPAARDRRGGSEDPHLTHRVARLVAAGVHPAANPAADLHPQGVQVMLNGRPLLTSAVERVSGGTTSTRFAISEAASVRRACGAFARLRHPGPHRRGSSHRLIRKESDGVSRQRPLRAKTPWPIFSAGP